MTVLITGATGLLGNNVVRKLLEQGESIRVLCRQSSDLRSLDGLDVEVLFGDIVERDAVRNACRDVEQIVHAAAEVRIGRTRIEQQRRINVFGTETVAQAARENGARLLHVSTVDALSSAARDGAVDEETAVVPKSNCGYVVTKSEAESVLLREVDAGLHASIVNPGFMLGPWDWKPSSGRMLLEVAKGKALFAPRGGMSVCDVRDVADGVIAALRQGMPGRRYILAGYNLSYLDSWRLFADVSGARKPIGRAGPLVLMAAGLVGDIVSSIRGREGEVNSAAIKMSGLFHYYRSDRAKQELGYCNRPLRQTVEDAWRWFNEHRRIRGH